MLGKVLHPRGVNREGLKSALRQVWRTAEGFRVESLGSKTFMFKFASEADKRDEFFLEVLGIDSSKRTEWHRRNNKASILRTQPFGCN